MFYLTSLKKKIENLEGENFDLKIALSFILKELNIRKTRGFSKLELHVCQYLGVVKEFFDEEVKRECMKIIEEEQLKIK